MGKNGTRKRKSAKVQSGEISVVARRVEAAMRLYGDSRADAEAFARVKILPPAVRPVDISAQEIRKAVRQVMRDYYDRQAKSLDRS